MSLPIKIDLGNGECRRLEPAAADGGPTYSSLVQPCQGWCPALRGYKLVLQYQDDENDWISISSDHELETAQNMAVGQERKTLKLQAQGHEVGPIGLISEEDAGTLATSVGLSLGGGGVAYAGNYTIKGLYTYSDGQYKDMVFFGQGGTEAQRLAPLHADSKQRVDDMLAEMRARAEAHAAGLTAGTAEIPFAGDDYATKGLYTYSEGRFQGAAFYGRGGTVGERGAPVDTKQRVGGIGPRQPKHRKWARPRPPAAGGRAAAHHQMSPAAGGWDPMEPGNMAIGVSECGTVATKAATSPDTWTGLIGTTAMSRGCNYWEVEILASGQPAKPEFFFGVAKQKAGAGHGERRWGIQLTGHMADPPSQQRRKVQRRGAGPVRPAGSSRRSHRHRARLRRRRRAGRGIRHPELLGERAQTGHGIRHHPQRRQLHAVRRHALPRRLAPHELGRLARLGPMAPQAIMQGRWSIVHGAMVRVACPCPWGGHFYGHRGRGSTCARRQDGAEPRRGGAGYTSYIIIHTGNT